MRGVLLIAPPVLVLAVGLAVWALRSDPPEPASPPPVQPAASGPAPRKPPPAPPAEAEPRAVDRFLADCGTLVKAGRLKEAAEKIDWSPPEGLNAAEAKRLKDFRDSLGRQALVLVESRTAEALALAGSGKLREATDRFQDFEDFAPPEATAAAYEKLRAAARGWTASRRAASHDETAKALAEFAARDGRVAAAADPAAAWTRAETDLAAGRSREAERTLTSLLRHPDWTLRALEARATARRDLDDPLGMLQDAAALLEAGRPEPAAGLVERALTRAPVDEYVLRLCERLVERNPAQARIWALMARIWTWRHDPEEASKLYFRATAKQVKFDGEASAGLMQYLELKEKGFPGGKPVVSDYAGPYEILTDAGPRRARALAKILDGVAREYAGGFRRGVNDLLRFRVMFFANDRDYQLYHKGVFGQSARERGAIAYYSPGIKQLVVVDSPKEFEEVVRHEAFHQFLDYFVHGAPRWFNEGTAAFFERSTFGRPALDAKYHQGARYGVSTKTLPPLEDLLRMKVEAWVGDPREFLFYCQAWSFIYWLHRQGRGALWEEYLDRLIRGASHEEAHRAVFAARIRELEPAWRRSVLEGTYDR